MVDRYFQIEMNALRPYSSRALEARFAHLLKCIALFDFSKNSQQKDLNEAREHLPTQFAGS